MSRAPVSAPLQSIRRLAVHRQHLAGSKQPRATASSIAALVREMPYVQWDPVSIVAPSHLISLWNRLGDFRASQLERLLWKERTVFLHWTPFAALVATADYPLYGSLMGRYPDSLSDSWGSQRAHAKKFLQEHAELRGRLLKQLRGGPLRIGQLEDHRRTSRAKADWTPTSDVSEMLYHLSMTGEVMVVGHEGNQNLWGRSEQFLPDPVRSARLTEEEADRQAAERAIRALGTATPKEINFYFVRGRYRDLRSTLASLAADSKIHPISVEGLGPRDDRYIHDRDVSLLDSMGTSIWQPRLSLLPPFDNLVCSTSRTSRLFGFDYVREQFLPKEKRKFGTYVLPILWGDRFVGRLDPRLDKSRGELVINAVHEEPGAHVDREVVDRIGETIDRFGAFLGAKTVRYTAHVPASWKSSLH
jgi:uncharacterized protein